ncbi:hypothetical protein Tco_0450813 [Tanacetum coccineum]
MEVFIHTILHCLSSRRLHGINLVATLLQTLICLATSRRFNFSKFIFDAWFRNLDRPTTNSYCILGCIQLLLNKQTKVTLTLLELYHFSNTSKLFSNMRRASKGYSGVVTPLFESMLVQAHDEEQLQSPSRITSSPSLFNKHCSIITSPEPIQPTHEAEETASMPYDSPLHAVHSHGRLAANKRKTYSIALTKLVLRIKKLEYKLKSGKARRKAKIVLSDDEEIAEDSSKQGRKISQIDEDPIISLVQDEGISWIPHEEEVNEKPSDETELLVQEETPTKIIKEHRSGEKGEMEISTANIQVSTASPPKLWMDEELARKTGRKKEKIRFNDRTGSKSLQEEDDDIKPIFERVWDHVNTFIPIGSEVEKDSSKLSEKETSKTVEEEKVEEEDVNPEQVLIEKKDVGIRRKTLARRRASDKQEKKYPLTKETLQKMLNWKLEAEAESSMEFKLLKFIKTQIEEQ